MNITIKYAYINITYRQYCKKKEKKKLTYSKNQFLNNINYMQKFNLSINKANVTIANLNLHK